MLHLRCSLPARILPCLLMLTEPRFSPQVLPARSLSVVDVRLSQVIPLVSLHFFIKKSATSLTSSGVPVEEPAADAEQFSDYASSYADEGEVSDHESTGPEWEELLDVDQELC